VSSIIENIFTALFVASVLRVSTPLLFPSLGALMSDRVGAINVGLEGMMLSSAFTGVMLTGHGVNLWVGVFAGLAVAILLALVIAVFHIELRADLILAGLAVNILASGATTALLFEFVGDKGSSATLGSKVVPNLRLHLDWVPGVGEFLDTAIGDQNLLTWLAVAAIPITWFVLQRTSLGTHIRAVGENPDAATAAGINTRRVRYLALSSSGLLAGLGGIHLGMGYLSLFQRDFTAGRGFIALAAPALGGGRPGRTALAALLFGGSDALATQLGSLDITPQYIQVIPYVTTLVALLIYSVRAERRIQRSIVGEADQAAVEVKVP